MKKILRYLPMIICMGLIFFFSSQTAAESSELSEPISTTVAEVCVQVLQLPTDTETVEELSLSFSFYVRKAAHVSLYLLLAVCVGVAFIRERAFWKNGTVILAVSFLYAFSDEFHQRFVGGRSGEFRDVLIDGIGIVLGTTAILFIAHLRKTKRGEKHGKIRMESHSD